MSTFLKRMFYGLCTIVVIAIVWALMVGAVWLINNNLRMFIQFVGTVAVFVACYLLGHMVEKEFIKK